MNWGWCWLRMREPNSPQRSNVPLPSPPTILRKHGLNPCCAKSSANLREGSMVWGMLGLGDPRGGTWTPVPFLCCSTHRPSPPPPPPHTHTGAVQGEFRTEIQWVFALRASLLAAPRQSFAPSPSLSGKNGEISTLSARGSGGCWEEHGAWNHGAGGLSSTLSLNTPWNLNTFLSLSFF